MVNTRLGSASSVASAFISSAWPVVKTVLSVFSDVGQYMCMQNSSIFWVDVE